MSFESAQRVADAVLYEGYLLYPYHAASEKNRVRFQFGVVAPRDFSLADGSESWEMQTECLLAAADAATIDVRIRFLQLQARTLEAVDPNLDEAFVPAESLDVEDETLVPWEDAVECRIDEPRVSVAGLCRAERIVPFSIQGAREVEDVRLPHGARVGRIVRTRWPIQGLLRLSAVRLGSLIRLRVRIENTTTAGPEVTTRAGALRRSLLGCHTLIAVESGSFLSLIDPPVEAAGAARGCANLHTWPVLAGEEGHGDLLLSSPIILYDFPSVAPESQGDLFDAT
jgi:hypothetical protein